MHEIEKQIRKENNFTDEEYIGNNYNIHSIEVECVNNKNNSYNITVGQHYIAEFVDIETGEDNTNKKFIYVFNNVKEMAKYDMKYFKLPTTHILTTETCTTCNIKRPTTRAFGYTAWTQIDGKKICKYCVLTLPKCHKCNKKTLNETSNFKEINGNLYCPTCYAEFEKTMIPCTVCKKPQMEVRNRAYNDFGFLCEPCLSGGKDREFRDLFRPDGDERRNVEIRAKETTFNDFPDRTFGVEFEVHSKGDYLRNNIKRLVKDLKDVSLGDGRTLFDYLRAKTDGSLDSKLGIELITTILRGDKGKEITEQLITIISRYFDTNEKCGLHIHLGVRDFTDEELTDVYYIYQRIENYFKYYVSAKRLSNQYCKKMKKHKVDEFIKGGKKIRDTFDGDKVEYKESYKRFKGGERYCAVNFESVSQHETVEIRVMEGNLDKERIIEWLRLHLTIIEWVRNNPTKVYDKNLKINEIIGRDQFQLLQLKKVLYNSSSKIKNKDSVSISAELGMLPSNDDEDEEFSEDDE